MGTKIDALQYSVTNTVDGMVKNKVQDVEKEFSSFMEVVASSYSNADVAGADNNVQSPDEQNGTEDISAVEQDTTTKEIKAQDVKKNPEDETQNVDADSIEDKIEEVCKKLGLSEDEFVENLEALNDELLTMVADLLGVTVEQLTQALNTLEMTPIDLMQISNLTEVMVSLGIVEDAGSVLTDESLFQQMKLVSEEVTAVINEFAEEYAIPMEEATEVLRQYSAVTEAPQMAVDAESSDAQSIVMEIQDERPPLQDEFADLSQDASQNNQMATGNQAVQQFTNQVVNAAVNSEIVYAATDMEQIVNQVVEQMKLNLNAESTSIEMQLNPESYGKVQLHVVVRDGVVTAQMAVENEAVRSALEAQVVTLKENMNNQGVKVEAIEVTIASHEFERNLQQDNNAGQEAYEQEQAKAAHRRVSLNLDDWQEEDVEQLTEAEQLERKMMLESGNRISYQI